MRNKNELHFNNNKTSTYLIDTAFKQNSYFYQPSYYQTKLKPYNNKNKKESIKYEISMY